MSETTDDQIGAKARGGRLVGGIVPDPDHSGGLAAADIPIETISDHPGARSLAARRPEHLVERLAIRFADPDLLLDLNVIDPAREIEAFEFGPLAPGATVGKNGKTETGAAQSVERRLGIFVEAVRRFPISRKRLGDFFGQIVIVEPKGREGGPDDAASGRRHVESVAVQIPVIGPELASRVVDCGGDIGRTPPTETIGVTRNERRPGLRPCAIGGDQRVIEIEDDELWPGHARVALELARRGQSAGRGSVRPDT